MSYVAAMRMLITQFRTVHLRASRGTVSVAAPGSPSKRQYTPPYLTELFDAGAAEWSRVVSRTLLAVRLSTGGDVRAEQIMDVLGVDVPVGISHEMAPAMGEFAGLFTLGT